MGSSGNRFCAVFFASGVLGILPLSGSFQGCCSDSGHHERCVPCASILPVCVNLSQAHADEPKASTGRPPMSSEAKVALEKLIEGNRALR